jgi:hypothetical protein
MRMYGGEQVAFDIDHLIVIHRDGFDSRGLATFQKPNSSAFLRHHHPPARLHAAGCNAAAYESWAGAARTNSILVAAGLKDKVALAWHRQQKLAVPDGRLYEQRSSLQ